MKELFELGEVIVKVLVRSKFSGSTQDNFVDIVSALKELGINEFEAREIKRDFENIADKIAASCKKVLENTNLEDERVIIIVKNILLAYENVNLNIDVFLNMQADQRQIKNKLLEANPNYKDDLEIREAELYERLLEHTACLIVETFISLPEFNKEGIKRLNIKMDDIVNKIDDILSQMEKIDVLVKDRGKKIRDFERYYRNNVINQNNYVYLFGAGSLSNEYKKYQLSVAYVELEIFDDFSDKVIKLDEIFRTSNNIWISGEAGMGKTTFLQWIAVKSAENGNDVYGLRDSVPLLIHLRKYDCKNMSLSQCIKNIMKDSSYEIPEGWIEQTIDTGRLLFLIDGFDEVNEVDRNEVLRWLDEVDSKGKCKKVFTARPQVKERPQITNLLELKILPMNRSRIKEFIEYWHKAVLDEQLKLDEEDAFRVAKELYERIGISEALLKLASTPLLCAMICALHYRNELNLPSNKRELYEECCKMLIENRDVERRIVREKIKLSYEQKKVILSKLAYWMMKNNHVEITFENAENVIKRAVDGMNISKEDKIEKDIFKYLLERCGILREPEIGKIDFLHRTFQEYLAAYEISREEDWGFIKDKIGDTVWQETIGICIGYAKKEIATDIIEETMQRGKKRHEEKRYLFIAIEYLNGAIVVDEILRRKIEEEVSELLPPQGEDCADLAKAGDLVVKYLENKQKYNIDEKIACLRVLRMVGTVKALEISKTYLNERLSGMELFEIGNLYGQFEKKELLENGIPLNIKEYIRNFCDPMVELHSEMLRVLNLLDKEDKDMVAEMPVNSLEIIAYKDNLFWDKDIRFNNLECLKIYGNFTNIDILNHVPKIKELLVYSGDEHFSIYDLNCYYNVYELKSFSIISSAEEYINGKDLKFLGKCKSLEIVLLNSFSEFMFDNFDLLKNLNDIKIGADFILDVDFSNIPANISKLTVLFPKMDEKDIKWINIDESVECVAFEHLEEFLIYHSNLENIAYIKDENDDYYL